MKQNLFNKLWLRVGMIVAIMTTALAGTAAAEDQTITLDYNSFGLTTSYAVKTATVNGFSFTVNQGYKGSGNTIQMNSSKGSGILYNTTAIPGLKSIKVNVASGNKTYTITTGTSEKPTTNSQTGTIGGTYNATSGDTFFQLKVSGASYFSSIEITYDPSSAVSVPSLSVSPDAIDFGEQKINDSYEETFDVTFANLTQDLSVSVGSGLTGVTVSPTTISKTATSPATVTVTYAPTEVGNISGNITVSNTADEVSQTVAVTGSAYDPANVPTYNLFTGNIEEGDYIIYYNGVAMKSTVSSNRLGYAEVTATNDVISTNDASIVWHIAKSGEYWTIYNAGIGKYAASTGSKNQGTLVDEVSENAKWTVTGSSTYDFENLARSTGSDPGNKWLRYNSGYGFACYASSTGGALSLYKLDDGTPSISADDVDIEYDATSGSIEYILHNATGVVSATVTNGNWLTLGTITTSEVPFTCSENPGKTNRTATVTLSYTDASDKVVTVTQAGNPNVVDAISGITTIDVDYAVRGTVVAVNAKGFVLGDGTGYVYTYLNTVPSVAFGDIKKISGTMGSHNGVFQFTSSASIEAAESSNYNSTPAIQILDATAIAGYSSETLHLSNYVQFEGTLIKNNNYYNIEVSGLDNTASIAYPTTAQATELDALLNKTVTVKGYFAGVSSGHFNVVMESVEEVEVQHNEYTLTVSNLSNVEMYVFDAADQSSALIEGEGNAQVYDGTEVLISVSAEAGYQLESLIVDGNDVTSQIDETTGAYTFNMPTHNVTVTATAEEYVAPVTAQYALATSITSGKTYVIANADGTKVMGKTQNNNNRAAVDATLNGTTLTAADACEFTVVLVEEGKYSFYDAVNDGYLYAASSSSNHLKTQSTLDDNGKWTIEIDGETGVASVVAQGTNSRNVMQYNNSSTLFACYGSASQTAIKLYEKVEPETEEVTVTAAGYATYCSENALDFTGTEITAYVGTIEGTHLTFTPITQVPANTGLLLKAEGGATVDVPVIASAPALTITNCLTGTNEAITLEEDDYILNVVNGKAGFYRATTQYTALAAHRAYISAEAGQGVKSFIFDDDDATAIGTVESFTEEGAIYNLAGQRLQKMQKGINIVNGKKVLK